MADKICKLDKFFNSSLGFKKVFKDPTVLKESYIPDEFLFRDKEKKKIMEELATYFHINSAPDDIYIHGSPSTGKTHLIKRIMYDVNEYADRLDEKFRLVYASFKERTCVNGLINLVRNFTDKNIPNNTSMDNLLKQLATFCRKYTIGFILDEVDKMMKTSKIRNPVASLIGSLERLFEKENISKDRYFLIVITNEDIVEQLTLADKSIFVPIKIHFRDYNIDEITKILEHRCKLAFHDGVIDDDVFDYLAREVNRLSNLRMGFKTLLTAGKIASRRDGKITVDIIDEALDQLQQNIIEEKIRNADITKILIIYGTAKIQKKKGEPATMTEVYNFYRSKEDRPFTFGYVSTYILPKLEEEGLIMSEVRGLGRGKGKARFLYVQNEKLDNIIEICEDELRKRWGEI